MAVLGASVINGSLVINGDTRIGTGGLYWKNVSLPEQTSPQYFLVLDDFASGGQTKWTNLVNLANVLPASIIQDKTLKTTFDATNNSYGATMKAINTYITSLLYNGAVE